MLEIEVNNLTHEKEAQNTAAPFMELQNGDRMYSSASPLLEIEYDSALANSNLSFPKA